MKKDLKRKHYAILLITIFIVGVGGYIGVISMQSNLNLEEIGNVEPGIKVFPDHVRIYGAVPINNLYVTGVDYSVQNQTLYINLKGFKIPLISTREGEYYYEIDVDSSDYNRIVYNGFDKKEDKVLYRDR